MKFVSSSRFLCNLFIITSFPVFADSLPSPLEGIIGDVTRGKALFENHRVSFCLLCHKEGALAPPLNGIGSRLTEGQLRFRIVDMRAINEKTLMPPFYSTEKLLNVHERFKNKTILTASQIEDLISFLRGYE